MVVSNVITETADKEKATLGLAQDEHLRPLGGQNQRAAKREVMESEGGKSWRNFGSEGV